MAFNADKFQRAQYEARTKTVELPALAEFFGEGEAPAFTVRGLSASELQRAREAASRGKSVDAVVKAIASQKDQVDTIRRALGMSSDTPGEVVRRLEMLVQGCVAPRLEHATAVKLAEVCPVEFYDLTNRITELTGLGASRVKPQPSSPTTPD